MNIVEKAGMSGIDKERINEIIHEASKGSLFYKKQAQRQEEIHNSIEKMLNKVKMATPSQVNNAKITWTISKNNDPLTRLSFISIWICFLLRLRSETIQNWQTSL